MAATDSLPTGDAGGLSVDDWRRIQAGMVAHAADGTPRTGVLPAHYDPLVTGKASMGYDIAPFVAVTSRQAGGVEFLANDASAAVTTTAAPGANSRIDVIWVRPQFTAYTDAANVPVFGVTQGTAGASPSKPSIPAGALELATAVVTSTDTTTATVVITQTHRYTAMAGGRVPVRNATELAAWVPARGSQAVQLDEDLVWQRHSSGWAVVGSRRFFASLTKANAQSTSATPNLYTAVEWDADASADGLWSSGAKTRIRLTKPGLWDVSASLRAASTVYARIRLNGIGDGVASTESGGTYPTPRGYVVCTNPATDYVEITVSQAASSAVGLVQTNCAARAVYLGG